MTSNKRKRAAHTTAWRTSTYRADDSRAKVKTESHGALVFDELVVGEWFHIEQMDDDAYWLRVGRHEFWITLHADGSADVRAHGSGPEDAALNRALANPLRAQTKGVKSAAKQLVAARNLITREAKAKAGRR